MNNVHRFLAIAALLGVSLLGTMSAQNGFVETDLVADAKPLIDSNGIVHTPVNLDPHLVNPWGVGTSGGSPFWVSDNNAGVSTLYNTAGTPQTLVVSMPSPGDPLGSSGTPTGLVFNISSDPNAFKLSGFSKAGAPVSARAVFLFSTEDGTILGWNPGVNPAGFDPAKAGTYAIIAVDNSAKPDAANGAVYKGLAIATDSNGRTLLYATNFRSGTVDVFDGNFATPTTPAPLPAHAFTDPNLKKGYAPFNIVSANGKLFVTYAVQNETRHDDVGGQSHGIVDTFDLDGSGQQRFAQHGQLNSPWGVAVAPASFGQFAGDILIGNFGNGHINVYSSTGEFVDKLRDPNGQAIVIDGLWTLRVGNGGNGGNANTVYFTAGPNGESDGLFGSLTPAQ
ncbi:MAG TPA: TIGR03118 family protein [Terriglobales bacterium]|jgi:uncharacterized protein (TIGR03118 family)|nr:TIGR03118 family protein [Terriglobales bacterium]